MKKFFLHPLIVVIFFQNSIHAEPLPSPASWAYAPRSKLLWSGEVEMDSFYDTREVISIREDLTVLYPAPVVLDECCSDVNDTPRFNMTAVRTLLRLDVEGPNIHSWRATARIETDFAGILNSALASLHLRHAFFKLANESDMILIGQYWHPLFVDDCFGKGWDIGAPIEAYARDPQFRWTHRSGKFEYIFAALEQGEAFKSNGPIGISSFYLRHAILPNIHAQFRYFIDKHIIGVGFDFKRLVPRTFFIVDSSISGAFSGVDLSGCAQPPVLPSACPSVKFKSVDEWVNNFSAIAYFAGNFNACVVDVKFLYTQNLVDLFGVGGYAVTKTNPLTGNRCYTPLQTAQGWIDINSTCENIVPGIFIGALKMLGSVDRIFEFDENGDPIIYGRDPNLTYVIRVAPRIVWNIKELRVALELQYSGAAWGKFNFDPYAKAHCAEYVQNLRPVLAVYYFF